MSKRIGLAVVAIAALAAVAWWWHGRTTSSHRARSSAGAAADRRSPGAAWSRIRVEPARLAGTVHDDRGAAVDGAVIEAARPGADPIAAAVRADGSFELEAAPGTYEVVAAAPGRVPARRADVVLRAGETTRVDLVLAAGGLVVGGVVSDTAGGAIEGALVVATRSAPRQAAGAAITDAGGRYALTLTPGRYRLTALHPEYVGAAAAVELTATAVTLDFALMPGGSIEGVVKELASGAPVPDATVVVERADPRSWVGAGVEAPVQSDGDGHFRITGLSPGAITLTASRDDAGLRAVNPPQLSLAIGEQVAGVELWVRATPYVDGQVVDEDGAAVGEARVIASCGEFPRWALADAAGHFRMFDLPPRACQLTAADGHHVSAKPVAITLAGAPITGVVVPVVRAPALIGRVDPPIAAEVTLDLGETRYERWRKQLAYRATAGDDGRFELAPLEAGPITIVAKAADGRRGQVTVEIPAAGSAEVTIALDSAATIAGRVHDPRGAPIAGAAVLVQPANVAFDGPGPDQAPTTADGSFALHGLAAGAYVLSVIDERGGRLRWAGVDGDAARAPMQLTLGEREDHRVDLAVEPEEGVITGVVRNSDGSPRADAWVSAALRWEELWGGGGAPSTRQAAVVTNAGGDAWGNTPPVLTDEQGRFALRGLRLGAYDVTAEAERGALRGTKERVHTGTATTIDLEALITITGTVTRDGGPVADFTVRLQLPGGRDQVRSFHDPAGHFAFARLVHERYELRVDSAAGAGTASVDARRGVTAAVTVAVVAIAHVKGRIVGEHGQRIEDIRVGAMTPTGAPPRRLAFDGEWQTPDADGAFELELAPAEYELVVVGTPAEARTRTIFTAIGGQTVDLGTIVRTAPVADH